MSRVVRIKRELGGQQSLRGSLSCSVSAPATGASRSPLSCLGVPTGHRGCTTLKVPTVVTTTGPVPARNPICFPSSHPQQRQALGRPGFPNTGVPKSGRKHGWHPRVRRGAWHSSEGTAKEFCTCSEALFYLPLPRLPVSAVLGGRTCLVKSKVGNWETLSSYSRFYSLSRLCITMAFQPQHTME